MAERGFNQAHRDNPIQWWLSTSLFTVGMLQLLIWGFARWHTLGMERRFELVLLVVAYPWPWVVMTFAKQRDAVVFCMFCYLALQASVMLLSH
jgi:hypothetical protein